MLTMEAKRATLKAPKCPTGLDTLGESRGGDAVVDLPYYARSDIRRLEGKHAIINGVREVRGFFSSLANSRDRSTPFGRHFLVLQQIQPKR